MTHQQTPPPSPDKPAQAARPRRLRLPASRAGRTALAACVAGALVAGTVGAVRIADRVSYDRAVASTRTVITALHAAENDYRDMATLLDDTVDETTATIEQYRAIKTAGLGGDTEHEKVQEALRELEHNVTWATSLRLPVLGEGSDVPDAKKWRAPADRAMVEDRHDRTIALTAQLEQGSSDAGSAARTLVEFTSSFKRERTAWAKTFPTAALAAVKQNASATAAKKKAVTVAAAAAAEDHAATPELLATFRVSLDALVKDHKAAIAAKEKAARDAAAQAERDAGDASWADPDTGWDNGETDNGGGGSSGDGGSGRSESGSGGGGNGGGSGGGGESGGAGSPPTITYGSYDCGGAEGITGGYQWGSYSNGSLVVPGSGVASVNGPYDDGSGWRVDWTCVIPDEW